MQAQHGNMVWQVSTYSTSNTIYTTYAMVVIFLWSILVFQRKFVTCHQLKLSII